MFNSYVCLPEGNDRYWLVKDQAATMFQHDPGHQAAAHELREELEGLKERMAGGAVLSCWCHQRWLRNPPKM